MNSDWKDGFLFLANQLALDFLNTRPVQDGEPTELLVDFGALLRWLQAAGVLSRSQAGKLERHWGESSRSRQTMNAMRDLREKLREEVLRWQGGGAVRSSAIEVLNGLMAKHPMLTRLKSSGTTTETYFELSQPEDLFAPLAQSAAVLFASVDRERVRKCGQCVLHFYDTSKKGTRRWCSMQLCGNRQKVAAYAERKRRMLRD